MVSFSVEEYLKLISACQELEETEENNYSDISDDSWIPVKSYIQEQMEKSKDYSANHKTLNIFTYRKEQIKEALFEATTLLVGEFMIRIEEYHGRPNIKNMPTNTQLTMDISVWQHKSKTPSGFPCNMNFNMDLFQDNRFTNRPWLAYFNASGYAHNIPIDTVVEIAKYLSAVQRLSSFM